MAGTCEYCNESLVSIKRGEFLDELTSGQLLKNSASWS